MKACILVLLMGTMAGGVCMEAKESGGLERTELSRPEPLLLDYVSEADSDRDEGENLRTLVDGPGHHYGQTFDRLEDRGEKDGPHWKLRLPVLPPPVASSGGPVSGVVAVAAVPDFASTALLLGLGGLGLFGFSRLNTFRHA